MNSKTQFELQSDYDSLYRAGKHHVGFQPAEDVFPDDMMSFEVFGCIQNGKAAYPDIPDDKWIEYDFSGNKEPIEEPSFID